MSKVTINGRPISDFNLRLGEIGSIWSMPAVQRGTTPVIGRVGVRASPEFAGAPKTIPLTLCLWGDTVTTANRRAKLDAVYRFLDGLLEVEFENEAGRIYQCRLEGAEARARTEPLAFVRGDVLIDLNLIVDSGVAQDRVPQVVGVPGGSALRTALPLGTYPSAPILEVPGPITTDLTVAYRGVAGGDALQSLVLDTSTTNVASDECLIINCDRERIWTFDGTDLTDAMSLYSSGDFPVFDPGDGDLGGEGCTVSSTHAMTAIYLKVWA